MSCTTSNITASQGSARPAGSCSTASPGRNGSPASTSSSPCRWHRKKLQRRGFNQAEALFRDWASARWTWCDALQRLRPTKVQWQLRRDERTENVHDAFAVKETIDVDKKHILLVDDIFTTGATLEACAHALKQKGAASVTGLVIASGAP
jgi:ComF family protein